MFLLTPNKFRLHKKTLLALVDDHLCVGFKAQFVNDDSAQVYRFNWFPMNYGCSPPHSMLGKVHKPLTGLGDILLQKRSVIPSFHKPAKDGPVGLLSLPDDD